MLICHLFCTDLQEIIEFCASEKSGQGCPKAFSSILPNILQSFWDTAAFQTTTCLASLQTVASPTRPKLWSTCTNYNLLWHSAVTTKVKDGNEVSVLQTQLEYWTYRRLLFPPQSKIAFPHIRQLRPGICNLTLCSVTILNISSMDTGLNEGWGMLNSSKLTPFNVLQWKPINQMTENVVCKTVGNCVMK